MAGPRGGVGREGAGPRGRRGTCFGARADDDAGGARGGVARAGGEQAAHAAPAE